MKSHLIVSAAALCLILFFTVNGSLGEQPDAAAVKSAISDSLPLKQLDYPILVNYTGSWDLRHVGE